MPEENTFKIKSLKKLGIKKEPLVDAQGEVVQPGSRILKGYWGEWIVFGSKVPGYTLKLKIRMTPSGSKIRLINPLMTPDNNWENRKTSVHIDWGDGRYDKFYKKKINSGRFNRTSPYTLEHNYTAEVGDEMWLSITSIEPLVPYGCEIVEMLGQFPYDRYDLNMDRDGHYCGLFGVDQYIETYPELNKLYGAGKTITKVSSELLDNWRDIGNMNRMFEGWGITEVPTNFFKYSNKFHPDPNPEGIYQHHNMIVDTCKSYYRTFANCPNLVTVNPGILAGVQSVTMTTEEMFDNCPKLTNTLYYAGGSALENASKMYRDCVSLESVDTDHFISSLSRLRTIESIFDGCSSLRIIDWDKFCAKAVNLINAKAAFRGTAFTEVAFNMREMTQLGSIEYMYADMVHLRKAISSSGPNTASKYQYWKHSQKESQNKLRISHLFENSGDRTLGMIIGEYFFHNLNSKDRLSYESAFPNETLPSTMYNICEPTYLDVSYIFAGAFIDKYEPNGYNATIDYMVNGLGGWNNGGTGYDVSHFFDGCTFVNNKDYISLNRVFDSWRISFFNYAFANLKSRIGYINTLQLFGPYLSNVRSAVGLFKNCTIDHRFDDYTMFGGLPQSNTHPDTGLIFCTDYSEMFMNVVYKFPDIPVDHVICNTASYQLGDDKKLTVVKARDLFTGSNIQCYRPISPLSDRRLSYDMHNFIKKTSAPKEWVMNGFYDTSDWQPIIEVKPFIMWVFIERKNTTFVLDKAPKVVDWGDGSSTSENRHTYSNAGYYRISITDANFCQPNTSSQALIYKLDGELPYGANASFSSSERNGSGNAYIQEIGPQVACLASTVDFEGLSGVIHPENYKYGNNNGLIFGVKSVDISEPSHTEIAFESEFIVIDSTTSVTLDITITPLYIGHNTNVYLNLGIDRLDRSQHHISLSESNPLWIPAQMLVMTDIHNSKDYKIDYGVHQFKMQDTGYLTSKHFARLKNIKKIPQLNNYRHVFIGQQSKYRISGSINRTSFPGLEEFGPNSNIGSCYMCAENPDIINVNNSYDNRKPKFIRDYIDFELENIPDEEISFFRLDHLPNSPEKFKDRPIGNVSIEVLLYDEDEGETNPERRLEFSNILPNIGKITSKDKKALIRVRSDVPLWPSCKNSIVGVYGIINNKEGDMYIHPYDIWMGNGGGQKLAPNIRHISEDLLWGLNSVTQSLSNMFEGTPIEEIPANLLNYYFGFNIHRMFANCTNLKVVPDNLIKTNSLNENRFNSIFNAQATFSGCTNIEYVFKPFQDGVCCVNARDMFKDCKTYAFKDSNDVDRDILHNVSIDYYTWYTKNANGNATGLTKMVIPNSITVPLLNHTNDGIIISRSSTNGDAKVGRYFANSFNLALYKDNPQMLNSVRFLFMNGEMSFNMTSDEVFKAFHSMKALTVFDIGDNHSNIFASEEVPKHNMLFSNSKLNRLFGLFKGVEFNYTPNLLFIRQDGMRKANGLLINASFDKIPYIEYVPATHLPDRVGRPIYIGGAKNATRYRPRVIDRMLRYRNDWINISYFMKGVSGELTCPNFNNFITRDQNDAFSFTDTMVSDETFTNIDRTSNIGKYFTESYVSRMFESNTSIKSDCNVFHIWYDATDATATYKNTTKFLHPPKDMFNNITQITSMISTFMGSNIRDLPDCNSRVNVYSKFAANSKVSLIPEYWFKYTGTDTLDIRYAFDDCKGLIVTDKLIDPAVTVPVLKYSSLRNAWSIIGDDPEIFEGVNTKFDGTDKSLVRVIPEEDLFRQTLDIHSERWTLSVKALGMETIGNEPVQDDNLFMVSWGDGSSPSVVSYRNMEWEDYSHKYDAKGRYQVMILSTQWCCYVNSPQDLSSKYTTYSIDGMLQNSTCREVCDTGLTNMFGFTVEKVFPTMFDKLSDVTTVKDLPSLFYNFKKLKEIPEQILWKMTALESIYRFAMYTPITTLPAKLLSKNAKLKNANSIAERCYSLTTIPEGLFDGNPLLETIQRGFCDIDTLTEAPRNLLAKNPNLLNIKNMFSDCDNMVMDNTYDDFLAKQTKLVNAECLFRNWIIRQLPPNLLNRCTSLKNADGMFALEDFSSVGWDSIDDARWKWYNDMSNRDTVFEIPSNWLPKSVVDASGMFFFRTKLTAYPSDLFTGNAVLEDANHMFMNTAIRRIHSETFKTMSHSHILNLERWIYKDKRFGKSFYIHYCPKVVSSAINVPTVRTESMLLGTYGTMTEAQLFSGVTTDPSNIHSLYVQEFEPAKFKLKMTGDGTFITFKPITKSDVTFTDLTMVQWGDGTEDLWEEPIAKADIQKVIKHNYKTPGEYTISVGAKYCLVPIVDDLPEAYQVESVVFPEDIDQVKQVSIDGEYGVGDLKINRDMIYATKQNAEVELSLVPRPHYVGETYTVDVTVEPRGLEVGEQTTVELNIVRDTSDPFERLEISGTLGPMEGYTEFPRVAEMPELQYKKWSGTETFFSRNTQITSFDRSFMNLNYEFRIADKVFQGLSNLNYMSHCFWNTKLVVEPGWAPDFNKNTKLTYVNSMFRAGIAADVGKVYENGITYIPAGTPVNKVTWKVNQDQYQPFSSLSSISDMGYIHNNGDITYAMTTNMSNMTNLQAAYTDAKSLSYLRADFFRTLKSSGTINCSSVFTDTSSLRTIQPAPDGKTLFEFTIGNNEVLRFDWTFAGSTLPIATVIDLINKSSFIKTTASGTNIDINNLFSWCRVLQSTDASALRLAIPSRTGTLDLTDLFSHDSDPSTTKYDKDVTILYNIKPGAITIAASGSPNVIVDNMFDHCYADATISDAHECFVVTGDDANFSKAKALADKSALNTLTVMTTTVVPK